MRCWLVSCTKGQHPQQTKESNGKVSELVSVRSMDMDRALILFNPQEYYWINKSTNSIAHTVPGFAFSSKLFIRVGVQKPKKMLSDLSNLALPGQYFSLYCCELARNCMTSCLHYCLILFPRPTMLGVAGDNKSSQPLPPSSSGTPTGDLKRASVCPCLSVAWCLVVEGHCTCGLLFLQEVLKL